MLDRIGVFTGVTTLGIALALPDDGKVIGLDISQEFTNIGRPFWEEAKVDHKIDLRIGLALEGLNQLIDNNECDTFDFIFIDADKVNILSYYEKALQLLKKGGVIAVDNTLWKCKVADSSVTDESTTAIRQLNDFIKHDDRVEFVLLTVCDGITLARKN